MNNTAIIGFAPVGRVNSGFLVVDIAAGVIKYKLVTGIARIIVVMKCPVQLVPFVCTSNTEPITAVFIFQCVDVVCSRCRCNRFIIAAVILRKLSAIC